MRQTTVTISEENDKAARIEGARQLGVQPDEVTVVQVNKATYIVSKKNAPGQFDIVIREDKMGAAIKTITPPLGNGKPVTVEDIKHALDDLNIVVGIDNQVIEKIVSEVIDTDIPRNNIQVAVGEAAKSGKDGRVELKIGRDAVNKVPSANSMVKQGQIIAVRVPPTKGEPGRNILGEEVAKHGKDVNFTAGDNVIVTEDGSTFIAALYGKARSTSKDVSVENLVKVNKSGMWAKISIFPTLADNSKLTFKDVCATLEQTGIVHGIKENLIKNVIEAGETVRNLTLAEATLAKDGVDARIEFKFRLNGDDPETIDAARQVGRLHASTILKEMFTAGDVLAIKIPMEAPVHGSTVLGDTIFGPTPKDKHVTAGTNVAVLDDGLTYVVAEDVTVSYADYVDGSLRADEPLLVSEDKFRVYLSVHPPSESGRMLTMELVEKLLSHRGIIQGVDLNAVEQVLSEVVSKNMPIHDVVVAEGIAPERGEDARIEFKFQQEKIAGIIDERSGRINYKERESIQSVKAGDILAVKTPLKHGKGGVDVFGDIITAEPGTEKVLTPASNVGASDDGLSFTSEIEGMVILTRDNKIFVAKQYEVPGDVDYSTGNLSMEGSLDIKGWIRSGFDVRASGEIRIGGGIENATVKAGGDIYIHGGIIGSGEGRVHAGGNLTARFIENARVHADGNIFVRDDILRSTVSANGSIIVTEGKGRIRGGSVEAVKGIEVNEIGSDAGVRTRVSVGMESKDRKLLADVKKRLTDFKRKRAKMDMTLAQYVKKRTKKALFQKTSRKLGTLAKLRREIVSKEARMTKYRKELVQKMSENEIEPVAVKVKKTVHLGTTVFVYDYVYHVTEDIRGKVLFVLNAEKQSIELVV